MAAWGVVRWRETERWNTYVDRLNAEPGLAVLSSGRRAGRFFVVGLRDPLARDPAALTAGLDLAPADIDSRWEPYQALLPSFVVARATDLLHPPDGVTLAFREGTLTSSGTAPEQWIGDSERIAPALAGVRQFQHAGPDPATLLRQRLEALTIHFARGRAQIEPDQRETLQEIVTTLAELDSTLAVRGRRGSIEIQGFYRHRRSRSVERLAEPGACECGPRRDRHALSDLAAVHDTRRWRDRARTRTGRGRQGRDRRASLRVTLSDAGSREQPPMIQKKICLLGAFGVGKTSLVSRFVHSIFSDKYLTTVGVKIEKKRVLARQRDVDLVIWDIYGEDDFQKVRLSYLRGASGYLLVADGTRRVTLDIAQALQKNAAATVGDVPFLLLVNKADLSDSWEIDERTLLDLERLNWTVIRTSAKTGAEVERAFSALADAMLNADGVQHETTS